ncbi:ABC transporter substrate-binding protein [Virgibacillus profundi]|uniref:ABC transporter substrate-binding protein n=1 Tax=Virgibacillus profundi TaxID=2024555 RepID=A0A2A2IJ85_9BACI|nr:extracellular solute-binding protein [Virgibacillus profundi]PAV31155.1 ABC transporter substrate-binding protein [Virgibacillus profundi]PXY55338.1 ABC transporter substrate-binding protein [Virgibacillus profundi]
MKIRKLLLFIIIAVMMLLVACSDEDAAGETNEEESKKNLDNVNESGFPIVDEQIKLDFFAGTSATTNASDWNDILIWNTYKEMSNVDVNWNTVTPDALEEKRNLALASGDLPDVFYAAQLPVTDVYKYGEQGVFIPLNDLIEEHAPNLQKLLEEYPDIKKALTFPDGNVYSFPYIFSPEFTSLRVGSMLWINKEWVDTLGMEMPETTEEYYQYLKAVKTEDPNGNGEADEIPYGGHVIDHLTQSLYGSFGIGNKGGGWIDEDPETGDVRLHAITDGYKQMLEYLHKLYSEGLIEQNIFSIEHSQYLANGAEGKYGSTVFYTPPQLFGEAGENFESTIALKGPNGDQMFSKVTHPLATMGGFSITNVNENPVATVKWMDYFYSNEGAKLYYMGVEGETYEETEDGPVYMDHITDSAEGLTREQEMTKYLTWVGVSAPGIIRQEYFGGSESSPEAVAAGEKIEPYIVDELWSNFTYTAEENKVLNSVGTDIEKYLAEMRDKFITGDAPLSEWDNYVETIKQMGLDEYLEVQQAAMERYRSE